METKTWKKSGGSSGFNISFEKSSDFLRLHLCEERSLWWRNDQGRWTRTGRMYWKVILAGMKTFNFDKYEWNFELDQNECIKLQQNLVPLNWKCQHYCLTIQIQLQIGRWLQLCYLAPYQRCKYPKFPLILNPISKILIRRPSADWRQARLPLTGEPISSVQLPWQSVMLTLSLTSFNRCHQSPCKRIMTMVNNAPLVFQQFCQCKHSET